MLTTQNIIIGVLVVIVVYFIYRSWSKAPAQVSNQPNANVLLDKLEQEGAIKQDPISAPSTEPAK
jgi:hypothetical protein